MIRKRRHEGEDSFQPPNPTDHWPPATSIPGRTIHPHRPANKPEDLSTWTAEQPNPPKDHWAEGPPNGLKKNDGDDNLLMWASR